MARRPPKNVLERMDHRVRVESKAMRLLVYLAERAGQDVGRDEILRAIWDGALVQGEVLTNAIWELRKAFGDDPPASPTSSRRFPARGIASSLR